MLSGQELIAFLYVVATDCVHDCAQQFVLGSEVVLQQREGNLRLACHAPQGELRVASIDQNCLCGCEDERFAPAAGLIPPR